MAGRVFGVCAFTTRAFGGNPAVVCLLESAVDAGWMQRVAGELNQATTAFLWTERGRRQLRWYTPTQQLPLCGHATLATAHVLYETGRVGGDQAITFHTPTTLIARRMGGGVWMDFPAVPVTQAPPPAEVLDALGLTDAAWYGHGDDDAVVRLGTPEQVEAVRPDFARILSLPVTRVMVCAPGAPGAGTGFAGVGAGAGFTARVFVPAVGLNEDQATGSAYAILGPLWAAWLGRAELTAVQASARRGEIAIAVAGDRVSIGGHAVITWHGELLV